MADFDAITAPELVETTVELGSETLTFSFDSRKVTPRWFKAQQVRLETQDVTAIPDALAEIIVSWNLISKGEAVEPSGEVLARFPFEYLNALMDALANVPASAEGEASSAPSSQSPPEDRSDSGRPSPESQPEHQNGAASSESPKPSESLSPT